MKILLIFIICPLFTDAQTVNMGIGVANYPFFQLEAGYENKILVVGSYEAIPVREAKTVNFYYGIKAGYKVFNIIPEIAYYFSEVKSQRFAYFLKYEMEINNNRDGYVEVGRLENLQIALGFKINIIK